MTWHSITTPADAAAFLATVGDFHDGCLREAHLWTGHAVHDNLAMSIGWGWDTRVRLLIQRQFRPLSAVELLFEEVRQFHVAASLPDYESIIFAATLTVRDGLIFWADRSAWTPDSGDRDDSTWIAAGRLSWRDASEWMGEALRYGPEAPAPPSA